ncbi:MAG TPA: outer membrane beta-barrel domain-containing protein [Anaeromyxobacteraceae bacterium]|nr:outer membrane beta-barrel domain-containing protein [Anaeromyxobacteraceae bacterium]
MSPATTTRSLAAALVLAAAAAPGAARAGNKADAFEGKIRPVSGQLYQKAGRLELTPLGALSLEDAFYTKYFGGLKATWHFSEFLAVSGEVSTGAAQRTGSAVVCPANQGCHPASQAELYQVPGRVRMIGGLELAWSPVYGKLNVFAEKVAHFDLSLLAGPDLVVHDEVLASADASALAAAGGKPATKNAFGGHVGLGVRLFLSEALALRWELKDYVYAVDVPNWQENGRARRDVQNQLFTELGLSVFFPFRNRAGTQGAP